MSRVWVCSLLKKRDDGLRVAFSHHVSCVDFDRRSTLRRWVSAAVLDRLSRCWTTCALDRLRPSIFILTSDQSSLLFAPAHRCRRSRETSLDFVLLHSLRPQITRFDHESLASPTDHSRRPFITRFTHESLASTMNNSLRLRSNTTQVIGIPSLRRPQSTGVFPPLHIFSLCSMTLGKCTIMRYFRDDLDLGIGIRLRLLEGRMRVAGRCCYCRTSAMRVDVTHCVLFASVSAMPFASIYIPC